MRHALWIVHVLEELLGTAVQIADDRLRVDDPLAIHLEDDSQHPVRRRVLGTEIHFHLVDVEHVSRLLALGSWLLGLARRVCPKSQEPRAKSPSVFSACPPSPVPPARRASGLCFHRWQSRSRSLRSPSRKPCNRSAPSRRRACP